MMFYAMKVNQDGTTVMFSGMSYEDANALFVRYTGGDCMFAMWGDAGSDVINTYTKEWF